MVQQKKLNRHGHQMIEQLEKGGPSKETLTLSKRRKKIVEPGDFRRTDGIWKKDNPQ